ncbi:MAG TPA: DUF4861 family protein [Terriglobales bacterium]|nr:DUF4861 family protein [Terriglobales bacterium]
MRIVFVSAVVLFSSLSVWAKPHLFGIKIAIKNPTGQERRAEHIVISLDTLRKIAPELNAGSLIVTATEAVTVAEDANVLKATEVPSQVDDLDGDTKADELAFEIDLHPNQTRIVTITYGDPERIYRLRSEYPHKTDALFTRKIEGIGWESEHDAWRLYFDERNAIDLYGKVRHSLLLRSMFGVPEYDYHAVSPYGRDIFKIGDALGIGAVGAWLDGKTQKVSHVSARTYRIISTGPVRAIVELSYEGWTVGGRKINLRSRITQWADDRGFFHHVTAENADGIMFATGLPLKENVPVFHSQAESPTTWLATYGEQVLMPGATATEALKGTNLGLGVIMLGGSAKPANDAANHLLTFPLRLGTAEWYATAAWDREGSNDQVSLGRPDDQRQYAVPNNAGEVISSRDQFLVSLRRTAAALTAPASVKILSTAPAPQSAPPDTLVPSQHKTYQQAITLLRAEIDRTAAKWEPILRASAPPTTHAGQGFFTEGDNQTGEWKQQTGFFWTGSFWTAELWKMYGATHDEKYRHWAEEWTAPFLGQETQQNHDTGFLYFYSVVPGFDLTNNPQYRDVATRAAQRLEQLYNPTTHLIAAWEVGGDDTIIDTMMNLQLLWWEWKQTGDPKWKDIALNHALRTAEWLVRPDGSVFQSVHYNPGDDRQKLKLHGAGSDSAINFQNSVPPGQPLFFHTHQGFSADTSWSRGTAWALYGFTAGYQATQDPRLLEVAQRVANFILAELPEDNVPWYDFADEGVHFRNRDSSAAAITAAALIRLSAATRDSTLANQYKAGARQITQSLIDHYLSPVGEHDSTPPGVLRHGSSTRPSDVPLIYGQYFLLEALLALEKTPHPEISSGRQIPK